MVVAMLALGIGVNSALFSVIDAVLLRPLEYKEPGQLFALLQTPKGGSVAAANMADYRTCSAFAGLASHEWRGFNLSGDGPPERILANGVSANYLQVLGIQPILGRDFLPEEDASGKNGVAIISYEFWQSHFGGDRSVIGKTILLEGSPSVIIGVLPEQFRSPRQLSERARPEVYVPAAYDAALLSNRTVYSLGVVGRLRPGATLSEAQAQLDAVSARLAQEFPASSGDLHPQLRLLQENLTQKHRFPLYLMMGAVGVILLVGCVNVANLLLVRTTHRQRDIAIRFALGATRWRIVRELLAESLILATIGGVLGLLLGIWIRDLLMVFAPKDIPRIGDANLNMHVVLFTAAISLLTSLLFGLLPAWQGSVNGSGDSTTRRWRSAFVTGEIALSLVLLTASVLLLKSFVKLNSNDLGYSPQHVLTMWINLPEMRYSTGDRRLQFFTDLEQRVRALPGVESVAFGNRLPLQGLITGGVRLSNEPDDQEHEAAIQAVSAGYFEALKIPVRMHGGIVYRSSDRPVAIVSEAFEKQLLQGRNAIGERFRREKNGPWFEIVGVAADTRQYGKEDRVRPYVYLFASQTNQYKPPLSGLAVRITGDPASLTGAIKKEVAAIDKDQPVMAVQKMDELVGAFTAQRRFQTTLILLFAMLAVCLTLVGVYGVVSYSVSQRSRELGIRAALGARRVQIVRLVLTQSTRTIVFGVVLGLAASFAGSRYIASLLYETKATDGATYAVASILLVTVALAASFIPARRAANADPLESLRHE